MNTLGNRIKHIRGAESQESFATKIGVSKGSLGGYERDENSPSAEAVLKICAGANISVEWLMTGRGPMRPGAPVSPPQQAFTEIPHAKNELDQYHDETPPVDGLKELMKQMDDRINMSKTLGIMKSNEDLSHQLLMERTLRHNRDQEVKDLKTSLIATQRELIDAQAKLSVLQSELLEIHKSRAADAFQEVGLGAIGAPASALSVHSTAHINK